MFLPKTDTWTPGSLEYHSSVTPIRGICTSMLLAAALRIRSDLNASADACH